MIFFTKTNKNKSNKYSRYDIEKNYKEFLKLKKHKKIFLGVTVGRSGLKWVLEILRLHEGIDGGGERNANTESFFRYSQHNKLNIDQTPLLNHIVYETLVDWENNNISFQLSPYFSHSIKFLINKIKPDGIIWGINDPFFTMQSFYNKGWYKEDFYFKKNPKQNYGLSVPDDIRINHFFGRIAPKGSFFNKWIKMTRVGKIAWFINETTKIIFKELNSYNKKKTFYFVLEKDDQNYDFYLKLMDWMKIKKKINKNKFMKIKFKGSYIYSSSENKSIQLSNKEKKEFYSLIKDYDKIYTKILNIKNEV
ncbi:hypothetical protein OAJ03_04915 [Candidatus Pelagibacter sp.]|nr:hypothetical protein [Candidatus Pelagibacter sp.]